MSARKRQAGAAKTGRFTMTWPAIGLALLFSLGSLVVGGGMLWTEWRYAMDGRLIDAQVTAHWSGYEKGSDGKQHYIHYLFMVDGQEIQTRDRVEPTAFASYPNGSIIQVQYVNGSPRVNRIEDPDKVRQGNSIGTLFFLVGSFFTLLMSMIVVRRLVSSLSSLISFIGRGSRRSLRDDL